MKDNAYMDQKLNIICGNALDELRKIPDRAKRILTDDGSIYIFMGIEINPEYIIMINERLAEPFLTFQCKRTYSILIDKCVQKKY